MTDMVGLGFNKKGFTLIELLIAILILMVILLGLLRGIIEYSRYTIRVKMKDRAVEIARTLSADLERMPYAKDESGTPSVFYSNNNNWNNSTCTNVCSFENQNADGDDFIDFYDPYNGLGNFSLPLANLNNMRLMPSSDGVNSLCQCNGNNCPTNLPVCTYEGFSDRRIYAGINVARIIDESGRETGKVAAVIVWYFEPFTNRLQIMNTIVVKDNK